MLKIYLNKQLTFHIVHGILKARILKWSAIPSSSGPHFVRTLHYDPSVLGGPTQDGSLSHWVRQDCGPCDQFSLFSVVVVFILSALWWMRIRGLWKLPDGRNRLWGKQGLVHQARILEWIACSFLQGIFPTQVSNPGLLHCRRILNQLSHQGSPRILEWIAYPFSSGSSQPRNQTRVSCIAADSY